MECETDRVMVALPAVRRGIGARARVAISVVLTAVLSGGCHQRTDGDRFRGAVEQVRSGRSDTIDAAAVAPQVADDDLAALGELHGLRNLVLDGTIVSDRGTAHLAALPDLEYLSLSDCRITDDGLTHLAALPKLRFLRLDGLLVTDAGLAAVGRLGGLRYLSLYRCRMTDAGLAHLRGLRELAVLSLDKTFVTAVGVRDLVPHLPRLRYLSLWETKVPAHEAAALSELRAELRVNR